MPNGTVAPTQTRVANNTQPVAKGGGAKPDAYAGKTGRNLVDSMKKDMKAAQGGDADAMKRLEELAKQNQELFKKFQDLMGGGPKPDPGTTPAPAPTNGPQPAPGPAPAPGGGGGGCPGGNCGGGGGGAGASGGAGSIMDFLKMLLELLMQKQQQPDQGDPNAAANPNGVAGANPIPAAGGGGVPAIGGV